MASACERALAIGGSFLPSFFDAEGGELRFRLERDELGRQGNSTAGRADVECAGKQHHEAAGNAPPSSPTRRNNEFPSAEDAIRYPSSST